MTEELVAASRVKNEIGRDQLGTTVPLFVDPYAKNRTTGSFILIDEATGVTVGRA